MSSTHRRRLVELLVAFLLGLGVAWYVAGFVADRADTGDTKKSRVIGVGRAETVAISSERQEGIRPGATTALDLSFDNHYDSAIQVDAVTVVVAGVVAPQASEELPCTTDDFVVRQLSQDPGVVIGADARATLGELGVEKQDWPAVGMVDRPVNQDGCQGAVLDLNYEATGTEVR